MPRLVGVWEGLELVGMRVCARVRVLGVIVDSGFSNPHGSEELGYQAHEIYLFFRNMIVVQF